jgi:hypothetical protein
MDLRCQICIAKIKMIKTRQEYRYLIHQTHKHHIVPRNPNIFEELKIDKWACTSAYCDICGAGGLVTFYGEPEFGWFCPKSPDGLCEYEQINGRYNDDDCIYCHMPYERK